MKTRIHIDDEIELEISGFSGKCDWIGAVAAIGGALLSSSAAGDQADAATEAASTSAAASKYATDIQKQMYDQTRADQTPWRTAGASGLNQLADLLGIQMPANQSGGVDVSSLQKQYNDALSNYNSILNNKNDNRGRYSKASYDPTAANSAKSQVDALKAQLDSATAPQSSSSLVPKSSEFGVLQKPFSMADYQEDPGYQFRLQQGEQALQRAASAGGRLYSGRAMKDLSAYNSGQASQEYGNAYNRYNNDQTTRYNRLSNMAGIGQTANSALSTAGTNYANAAGNNAISTGNNTANAQLAAGNANASGYQSWANSLSGLANNKNFTNNLSNMFGGNTYNSAEWGDGGWGG